MFEIYWDDVLIGYSAVLPQPSGTMKYAVRGHRTVVLPDYQGLGFGTRISDFIAKYYVENGYKYFSRSTHVRFGRHRGDSPLWVTTATNQKKRAERDDNKMLGGYDSTRIAYSFEYVGENYSKPHQRIVCSGECDYDMANRLFDIMLDKDKYPIVVTGVADINVVTVWERIAKERGIRSEILQVKRKGELFVNNTSISGELDCILTTSESRQLLSHVKDNIKKCITRYDDNDNEYYLLDTNAKTRTLITI